MTADSHDSTGSQFGSSIQTGVNSIEIIERPEKFARTASAWGSDAIADTLRALEIPYVALNPGASFRGLHDSLVNHLGNERPQILLCLHEETAVALAHGYAKIAAKPMGVVVHSNVGLMHATMAIFDAWCDRVPVIVLGATGPVDADKRRPWIDWIHTARDLGALVRGYTKWDDQPASIPAAIEAIMRGHLLATTAPQGPVYICLDSALQESKLANAAYMPEVERFSTPAPAVPAPDLADLAARRLRNALCPIILIGRVSRDVAHWSKRIALAEALGAVVLTDGMFGAAFPTMHALHGPGFKYKKLRSKSEILRDADVILALDCLDLAGTLKNAWAGERVSAYIIQASVDQQVHNGWSMDHQALAPVDLRILAEPDQMVESLLDALDRTGVRSIPAWPEREPSAQSAPDTPEPTFLTDRTAITIPRLALCLKKALDGRPSSLVRKPFGWAGHLWDVEHPLDLLGDDGGGGVGSGPGMTVGAALALRGTGRIPISVLGDGDFLMGITALWTAVHYRIPLLIVVANNRSYFNDEVHQDRVAQERGRPTENRWIGQRLRDPDINLALLARGQGATGLGPVNTPADLLATLRQAITEVAAGNVVVVDALIEDDKRLSKSKPSRASPQDFGQ